jgi:LuxR family maltose regulon positive regulatory protein
LIAYDVLDGYCALFDLARRERKLDAAEQAILGVDYLAKHCGFPQPILNRAEAMRARIAICAGDWRSVHHWLEQAKIHRRSHFKFHELYEAYTAIQALVFVKDLDQAKSLVENLLLVAETGQWWMEVAHCQAWLAAILYQQGNLQAAMRALRECIHFAMQQGCARVVLDTSDAIWDLLDKLPGELSLAGNQDATLAVYVQKLIGSREAVYRPVWFAWPGTNLSEPLTDREVDVLELLARGHSNQEIAETMVVSLSTVKFHLKNIYLKLGVHTRTQAIARAGELRLI